MSEINYNMINKEADALLSGINYNISLLSNASALLNEHLNSINWVGFYLYQDNKLILGPFQGKPACLEIPMGRGVCGTAAKENKTLVVKDVHEFEGHIACDACSRSEIVVPIYNNGKLYGVLDIDSPNIGRFSDDDKEGLETFVKIVEKHLN